VKQTTVTTDSTTLAVTLTEVKAHLVIDASYTADDTLLTAYITSARQLLEQFTNRSFGEKTLKCYTDQSELTLLYGPNQVITGIVDNNGETLVANTDYEYNGSLEALQVTINGGSSPYMITYTAGYTTLPEALKLAIKEQVKYIYNNRGEGEAENKLAFSAKVLADSYSHNGYFLAD